MELSLETEFGQVDGKGHNQLYKKCCVLHACFAGTFPIPSDVTALRARKEN